jgi:hypothetical protein
LAGSIPQSRQPRPPTGQAFWQDEFLDHHVRDEAELDRIVDYVEYDRSAPAWQ